MTDIQYSLFLLGSLAILGVIIHGLWTLKRQKAMKKKYDFKMKSQVKVSPEPAPKKQQEPHVSLSSEPEPVMTDTSVQTQPQIDIIECEPHTPLSFGDQKENKRENKEQAPLDVIVQNDSEIEEVPHSSQTIKVEDVQDVLVIHVRARQPYYLAGDKLLESLMSLGLQHGEMNIFHRHQSLNRQGNIMFSLANMAAPGLFQVEEMPHQHYHGISLFMKLPTSQALLKLTLMINAASQLSEDLHADMLNDQLEAWTSECKQSYINRMDKVRELEPIL